MEKTTGPKEHQLHHVLFLDNGFSSGHRHVVPEPYWFHSVLLMKGSKVSHTHRCWAVFTAFIHRRKMSQNSPARVNMACVYNGIKKCHYMFFYLLKIMISYLKYKQIFLNINITVSTVFTVQTIRSFNSYWNTWNVWWRRLLSVIPAHLSWVIWCAWLLSALID